MQPQPQQNQQFKTPQPIGQSSVSFLALGGEEDVTRNLYVYEYNNQILIVDCGLGFPDESMLGVDLLLPDISYLLEVVKTGKKKIVGMVLTHGHEDHIGGLPFILPQLPQFPIYASPLTAALSNEKLREFNLPTSVQEVKFSDSERKIGAFTVSFVHVTHSVPDSANIIIKTPGGNFFHGSDFKFDLTPADGYRTEFDKIAKAANEGITALMSDCLGSDRPGHTSSEYHLGEHFENELRYCQGKFLITTYSSNIARVQQAVTAAEKLGRKVCFVGRSVVKVKEIAQRMGYLKMKPGTEVPLESIKNYKSNQLVLLVAGSQGQENSALTRIANNEHRDVRLTPGDVVVFSSDTIPGNELSVQSLMEAIVKRGARIANVESPGIFHVSGHGSSGDHMLLIALTKPKYLVPISGTYMHMTAYKALALKMGYKPNEIFLVENGQEVYFTNGTARLGKKVQAKNVFVDEVSGEEVEKFVVRDRERLAKEGIAVIIAEVKSEDGQLATKPEIILRGSSLNANEDFSTILMQDIEKSLSNNKGPVANWAHVRKLINEAAGKNLAKKFRTRPLILPVVIEV